MGCGTDVQAVKGQLPLEILPGGQRERHQDPDILHIDRQFVVDGRPEAVEKELGLLEPGELLQDPPVQLHTFDALSGESREGLGPGQTEPAPAQSI